jgi:hypothetical protein
MTTNPINFQAIVFALKEKHDAYLGKYSPYIQKNLNEQQYERDMAYARLKLIAEALVKAGAADRCFNIDPTGWPGSLALFPRIGNSPFFLLNNGTEAVVACFGPVPLGSGDKHSVVSLLPSGGRRLHYEKHEDILSEAFDWKAFALTVLEAIHKVSYSQDEAAVDALKFGSVGD